MSEFVLVTVVMLSVISAGLMAGVYFAFSGFIMKSLDQHGTDHGSEVMRIINRVILKSWFMPLFFGSTLLYGALIVMALVSENLTGRGYLLSAGIIYVTGMFLCTALFNVPLNNRLDRTQSGEEGLSAVWNHYLTRWTAWNHVRAGCSLVSMILSIQYLMHYH